MIQIVVPMGGAGRRFAERGQTFPKPLIEIGDRSMVEIVIHNIMPEGDHRFIFVCRQQDIDGFALDLVLHQLAPGCLVLGMRNATAGALCSVLCAREHLDVGGELLIANADQYIEHGISAFIATARAGKWDGCAVTFPSTHPKWSYVKVEGDAVIAVAEKRPISSEATAGLYYFARCADFLEAAERMLMKNATVGGEFYVAPVYNEMILLGRRVGRYPIAREEMHSLGTPEDVDLFAKSVAPSLKW